jgi:hypothetical protein
MRTPASNKCQDQALLISTRDITSHGTRSENNDLHEVHDGHCTRRLSPQQMINSSLTVQ